MICEIHVRFAQRRLSSARDDPLLFLHAHFWIGGLDSRIYTAPFVALIYAKHDALHLRLSRRVRVQTFSSAPRRHRASRHHRNNPFAALRFCLDPDKFRRRENTFRRLRGYRRPGARLRHSLHRSNHGRSHAAASKTRIRFHDAQREQRSIKAIPKPRIPRR